MKFFQMYSPYSSDSPCTKFAFLSDGRERGVSPRDALSVTGVIQIVLASKGRKWMDFVPGRDHFSPILCSERVLRACDENGFTGFKAIPTILYLNNGRIIEPPCPYFWFLPTGLPLRLLYRYYSGTSKNRFQKIVRESEKDQDEVSFSSQTGETLYRLMVPDPKSWDGSDFNPFTEYELFSNIGSFRCSRRVVEVAAQQKWTNILFSASGELLIQHLKDDWCPKGFYDDSD